MNIWLIHSRYIMLAYVLCLRRISKALCEMFPTNESLIQHGLITRYMLSKLTYRLIIIDIRAEMVMLEGEAKRAMCPKSSSTLTPTRCLGRVWHAPLSWANVMIRRSLSLSQFHFHNFTLSQFQTNMPLSTGQTLWSGGLTGCPWRVHFSDLKECLFRATADDVSVHFHFPTFTISHFHFHNFRAKADGVSIESKFEPELMKQVGSGLIWRDQFKSINSQTIDQSITID